MRKLPRLPRSGMEDGSERMNNQDSRLDFALFLPSKETRDAVRDARIG